MMSNSAEVCVQDCQRISEVNCRPIQDATTRDIKHMHVHTDINIYPHIHITHCRTESNTITPIKKKI